MIHTLKPKSSFLLIASFCGLLSCKTAQNQENTSSLDGHFENSSHSEILSFKNQMQPVAEYEPTDKVILGLEALTLYTKADLVREILSSGVREIWVTVPSSITIDFSHEALQPVASQLTSAERAKIKFIRQSEPGKVTTWARDWAPLFVRSRTTRDLHFLDFNYAGGRYGDDATPRTFENQFPEFRNKRVSIPLYNELGNFVASSQGSCFMTDHIVQSNAAKRIQEDMVFNDEQIRQFFRDYAGCRAVFITEKLPYEVTGHIDMWLKVLGENTLLISEVTDEQLQNIGTEADNETSRDSRFSLRLGTGPEGQPQSYGYVNEMKEIQTFLNHYAASFARMGWRVERVPMPLLSSGPLGKVVRSYTNSLLLNGRALIPSYQKNSRGRGYPDSSRIGSMENAVANTYRALGYEPVFLNADDIIAANGAIHCITMQVPKG